MLYNRCTGIYKFGNNTYPRRIKHRSNLGHIFGGEKSASYGLWKYGTLHKNIAMKQIHYTSEYTYYKDCINTKVITTGKTLLFFV